MKYSEHMKKEKEKIKSKVIWFVKFYLVLIGVIILLSLYEHVLS